MFKAPQQARQEPRLRLFQEFSLVLLPASTEVAAVVVTYVGS